MATLPRKGPITPEQREALQLLADIPHGVTEDLLVLAHGFDRDMIAGLVSTGLATAWRETIRAGAMPSEVVRIRITEAGQDALKPALSRCDPYLARPGRGLPARECRPTTARQAGGVAGDDAVVKRAIVLLQAAKACRLWKCRAEASQG
jgi:hypothetical protein